VMLMSEDEKPAPFFLNHFFVTLDSKTYAAIEQDSFLKREFAAFEKRTTVRADLTYSGIYYYGSDTYFEFFDRSGGGIQTQSGIAFGVEVPGGSQQIQKRIEIDSKAGPFPITRNWNGVNIPWFLLVAPEMGDQKVLDAWTMEYDPRFLREWHPEKKTPSSDISRKSILARYKAVLSDVPDAPLLDNVIGVTVAIDDATASSFAKFCEELGYVRKNDTFQGPDVTIKIIDPTDNARGITAVDFSLTRDAESFGTKQYGASRLSFSKGKKATWSF